MMLFSYPMTHQRKIVIDAHVALCQNPVFSYTHKMKKNLRLAIITLCLPSLAACGSFGYNKNPPDEFNIVRRAPLIIPPEFNLRPPSQNSSRPASPQGADLARLVVLKGPQKLDKMDAVETRLLEKAARGGVYGDGIREELSNKRSGLVSENADLVEDLVTDRAEPKTE